MLLIIIVTIILYGLSIIWAWKSLGGIEKPKKIILIVIGMLITYLITLLVFTISKNGIDYPKEIVEKEIRRTILAIFTGVNLLILLPYTSNQLSKIHEGEIEQKDFIKRMIILIVIFIICMWIECGYMNDTQARNITDISIEKIEEDKNAKRKSNCNMWTNCVRKNSFINRTC